MALSLGNSSGAGLPASQFGKERSLQPAACKLEALVSATLLRAPWFLPKDGSREHQQEHGQTTGGAGVCALHIAKKVRASRIAMLWRLTCMSHLCKMAYSLK